MTTEQRALLLDMAAVIEVVSALRRYRAAVCEALAKRYSDGELDAMACLSLVNACQEIENDLTARKDVE